MVVKMRTGYLKLNTNSLIRYFMTVLKEKTGVERRPESDYAIYGPTLKRRVIDTFVLNGWTVDDMTEFVHWIFDNKPSEKWNLNMLQHFINDWVRARREAEAEKREDRAVDRSEEEQFLLYLGEGYFDSELTKLQYWTGLKWRWKNYSPVELARIETRHQKSYRPETIQRLQEWESDLRRTDFDPIRQFYLELAANQEKTVLDTLTTFDRLNYKDLYTEHELNIVPAHAPVDSPEVL